MNKSVDSLRFATLGVNYKVIPDTDSGFTNAVRMKTYHLRTFEDSTRYSDHNASAALKYKRNDRVYENN